MYSIISEGLKILSFSTLEDARNWAAIATNGNMKDWPIIQGPESRLQQVRGPNARPAWKLDP